MFQPLGVYVSVPFCRAKCTYCNFASGVYGAERMDAYVNRLSLEIAGSRTRAADLSADLPDVVDTVYFGGGTPSLLEARQIGLICAALRGAFKIDSAAEITLECAPGQLASDTLEELLRQGLSRISFGVQSFSDREAQAVGRTHTREVCLAEVDRMRSAGVADINLDLIVGLPHQTHASCLDSLRTAIDSGVPHISVYMLEVDEDSRLGREVLGAGSRYGAASIPTEDQIAAWYSEACELLNTAGVTQYEISNFARFGFASRHNLKYWKREPYLGFGLDAHSMLSAHGSETEAAVRWANTDNLDEYLKEAAEPSVTGPFAVLPSTPPDVDRIGRMEAFEETVFLGLRLNEGIELDCLSARFGEALVDHLRGALRDPREAGLVEDANGRLRLTPQGRMVSNEVFGRVLVAPTPVEA